MSCVHRAAGRWGRIWTCWLLAAVTSFGVLEAAALFREGSPATLSAYIRQTAGLAPRCRHHPLGRAVILGLCAWAAAHLGWGVLGLAPRAAQGGTARV